MPRADTLGTCEIVASAELVAHVAARCGRIYVWPSRARCCARSITLRASLDPPRGEFRLLAFEPFDVLVPVGLRSPASLHLELGRRDHLRAYWNGLAWIG
jgi:hypothetical protein